MLREEEDDDDLGRATVVGFKFDRVFLFVIFLFVKYCAMMMHYMQ